MSECNICVSKYNRTNLCKVTCFACGYEACRQCITQCLQSYGIRCASCSVPWNATFIQSAFPKIWIKKEYQDILLKQDLEMEKAKMPETTALLARIKEDMVRNDLARKQRNMSISRTSAVIRGLLDMKEYNEAYKEYTVFRRREGLGSIEDDRPVNVPDQPCPIDDCRGYLQSWKCNLCSIKICAHCREIEVKDHECDPEIVETVKQILKECRPCPKCKAVISKVSGCDQMWCTMCHTAFSWKGGHIVNGPIHNPHYYEQMFAKAERQEAPQPARVLNPCDLVTIDHIPFTSFTAREHLRLIIESEESLARRFDIAELPEQLRIRFEHLAEPMTDEEWTNKLKRYAREIRFRHDVSAVVHTLNQTVRELITMWYRDGCVKENYPNEEITRLINLTNEEIKRIQTFHAVTRQISVRSNLRFEANTT